MRPHPHHQPAEFGDEALSINPENREGEGRSDAPTREMSAAPPPTRELAAVPAAGSGDRCSNCGASLAHDQQYCVECGERRGQLTLPQAQPVTEVRTSRRRSAAAPRPPRVSSGTTVISFVGVLLLAIGLGVLIGRIGHDTTTPKSGGTQVISVNNGAAPTTTAASAPTTTSGSHVSKKTQSKLNAAAKAKAPPSAAVQKKATQAAGKVLGNSNNLAPPTVTTGQKCSSSQAGCSGGSFNGNFFGQ